MPNTFYLIGSTTVKAGGAPSIDFTSIPNTYTDICLRLSLRASNALAYNGSLVTFNGSTSGYSEVGLYTNGLSGGALTGIVTIANSGTQIDYLWTNGASTTTASFGNSEIYIPNYAGANNKHVSFGITTQNSATTVNSFFSGIMAGLWSNTSAINRVTITPGSSATFLENSTASLYGIKNS